MKVKDLNTNQCPMNNLNSNLCNLYGEATLHKMHRFEAIQIQTEIYNFIQ
jgi:hypothetical protein